jgi:hypothetical protein
MVAPLGVAVFRAVRRDRLPKVPAPVTVAKLAAPAMLVLALGGCAKTGEVVDAAGGISAVRSACPTVGIPAGTGDVTLFDPPASREAKAIDVVANLTNLRSTCDDAGSGADIVTNLTFDVQARRRDAGGARDVTLPYYVTVVQGGTSVVSKRIGRVTLHFDAGQLRAQTSGTATALVSREAATLPQDVRDQLTRRRKAGEEDAAIDPLSNPQTRQAVARSTFEALVGFQLTDEQLRYNISR